MKRGQLKAAIVILITFFFVSGFETAVAAEKQINLKFANYYPPVAAQSKICEDFIKDLEKRTDGRVKVKYYPGGSLVNGPGMIKAIEMGITDIGLAHIQYTPGRMPITEACDLPHGFASSWVASHVVQDFYHKFEPPAWKKTKPLVFFTNTPSVLVLNKPVKKMEDLKGLTIRAPGPIGDVIKALGGSPAPTPIVETYDAMAKGVVDGAFVASETFKTFRFAEVAEYATNAWHVGSTYTFYIVMNKRKYNRLPEDIKNILMNVAGKYEERFPLMENAIDMEGVKAAKREGVQFTNLDKAQFEKWEETSSVVIDDYIERMKEAGHKEAEIKEWLDFIEKRKEYWTQKQIDLNLKTITGPEEVRP